MAIPTSLPLSQYRHAAETLAGRLPDLRTQALRIAATVAMGVHGRRQPGSGDSFWQFRPYRAGDSIRAIDWRRTARGERPFVREREWEAAESYWLWLDLSPSMAYRGSAHVPEKQERAAVIALALASLLLRSGERVGLLLPTGATPAGFGARALDRLVQQLADASQTEAAQNTSLPPAVALPKHARLMAFGDTWAPLADWQSRVEQLAAPGVRGHLVHILDPSEQSFPLQGRLRLEGLEGEPSELLRRAEDLAEPYAERLRHHCDGLAAICTRRGWTYRRHSTEAPALPLMLSLFQAITLDRRSTYA